MRLLVLLIALLFSLPAMAEVTAAYENGKTAFVDAGQPPSGTAIIVFERADKAEGPWQKRGELPYRGTASFRDSSFSQFLDKDLKDGQTYYYRVSYLAQDGRVITIAPVLAFENKEP